jgi:hypothetical protein
VKTFSVLTLALILHTAAVIALDRGDSPTRDFFSCTPYALCVTVPALMCAVSLAVCRYAEHQRNRAAARCAQDRCPFCGYQLEGTAANLCPECGRNPLTPNPDPAPSLSRLARAGAVFACAVLLAVWFVPYRATNTVVTVFHLRPLLKDTSREVVVAWSVPRGGRVFLRQILKEREQVRQQKGWDLPKTGARLTVAPRMKNKFSSGEFIVYPEPGAASVLALPSMEDWAFPEGGLISYLAKNLHATPDEIVDHPELLIGTPREAASLIQHPVQLTDGMSAGVSTIIPLLYPVNLLRLPLALFPAIAYWLWLRIRPGGPYARSR